MTKNYSQIDKLLNTNRLVLASGSPRRVALLKEANVIFRQIVPEIDESNNFNLAPYDLAVHLAEQKADAIMDSINGNEVALGSDTIVVLDNEVLGKPLSKDDAVSMLIRMSGKSHFVCTAIALIDKSGNKVSGYELSKVTFKKVNKSQITQYVDSGEPMDKAGSYGIQEKGVFLVDTVEGNIDNVIGLPFSLLDRLAGKLAEIKGL